MARKKRRRLGDILVEWGVTSQQSIEEALAHGRKKGLRIGEALVALNLASEEDVAKALASQFDMEYIDLAPDTQATEAHLLPEEVIRNRMVLPLSREGNKLKVVITDPLDLEAMDMLRFRLNCEIQPCLTSKAKFRAYLNKSNPASSDVSIDAAVDEIRRQTIDVAPGEAQGLDLLEDDGTAPIVRLVTMLITEAVEMRASDIHVEPMTNRVRVRYRIDGVCIDRENIPKRMQGPVINRLKIMAGIDLAEKRLPQDGRIKLDVAGSKIDFRVSSLPAYHGESVVLRILRPESVRLGIPALGFEQDDYERFLRIIRRPNGIFLVTGPTGSGKTTTLYAALNELNRPDRKIITAEDPVEYNFTGINQVQVQRGHRPDLRPDPAGHASPGPQHHPGRRNPRYGGRRGGHPGRPDRTPGVQHTPHQRCPLRHHPPDRHGRQALPGRQLHPGDHGPAAHPRDLPRMQAGRQGCRPAGPQDAGLRQGGD